MICSVCTDPKTFDDLHKDGRRSSGLADPLVCVGCVAEATRARHREDKRRYRKSGTYNPDVYRDWRLRKTYGISLVQFNEMLESQGGCCAVCQADNPQWSKGWHLDHCHDTGKVRGVLCHKCNLMIGLSGDNTTTLEAAAEYLRTHA